jgi:FYVE zinc finger
MNLYVEFGVGFVRLATSQEMAIMRLEVSTTPNICCSLLIFLGAERNHTDEFMDLRRKNVDKLHLETSRLEKRLSKLTQLLANPPPPTEPENRSILWGLGGGAKSHLRTLEQSIIAWEDDASIPKCPFCQQEFTNYSFRRHHCRMCGRIVCGDPQTHCSVPIGLNVADGMSYLALGECRLLLTFHRKGVIADRC